MIVGFFFRCALLVGIHLDVKKHCSLVLLVLNGHAMKIKAF